MAVIDLFTYNGEADLLELRLQILDPLVDQFIICEAPTTFGGNLKLLHYQNHKERFKQWEHKIKYFLIDDIYTPEEVEQARSSPYTNGEVRWMHEFLQKERIKCALDGLRDEDTVYVGDVDEIWEHREPNGIEKLKLRVYTYYLNMTSTEEFWGPIRAKYKDLKGQCFNNLRNNVEYRTEDYQGWHFTNQGGIVAVKQKAIDQYNDICFNGKLIYEGIDQNFGIRDFVGRDFKLEIDESNWPPWLTVHRSEFEHLLK